MQIRFILVEPAVPGNVGAAARALKTMGFSNLELVNPCDCMSEEARMLAHGSHDVLKGAGIHNSLHGALEGLDLAVATTSKQRQVRLEYCPVTELGQVLQAKGKTIRSAGIVFGREESGLTNDEIRMCDMVSTVPLAQPYPSLNLGQAVMIYAFTLSEFFRGGVLQGFSGRPDKEGFREMMKRSEKVLKELKMDQNPALYNRVLERLAGMGEDDIHLVHSLLNRYESIREGR